MEFIKYLLYNLNTQLIYHKNIKKLYDVQKGMEKMTKTRMAALLTSAFLAASLAGCSSQSAPAQQTAQSEGTGTASQGEAPKEEYTLMYGFVQGETHPYYTAFKEWADAVESDTEGGLKIELYTAGTLGAEEDIINSFKTSDTNWGYSTDFARLGTYVDELALFNLPYFVTSMEEIKKAESLDCVKEWIKELEEEYDVKIVSLNLVQGYRNVVTGKEVRTPEDLAGLTLRCPNTEIWRAAISSLGCAVQGMGRSDIYNNLVNKVIDGYEDVYSCITSESYYEIENVSVVSETRHVLLLNPTVVDAGWFYSLPEEYQTALCEDADEIFEKASEEILNTYEEQEKQKCIESGMTVIPPEEIDIDAFKEAGQKAYEDLGLMEVYNQVKAEME